MPAGQIVQVASVEPADAVYRPAMQLVHTEELSRLAVPAVHSLEGSNNRVEEVRDSHRWHKKEEAQLRLAIIRQKER